MPVPHRTLTVAVGLLAVALLAPSPARAGKVGWLDEVVQQVVREAEEGAQVAARVEGRSVARAGGKLFAGQAEESLEALARRSDELARLARAGDEPAEAALRIRFNRLVGSDPQMARTFANLAPAEKRLVVEMGEAAQMIARRYPGQAEPMIRKLGVEGLAAVRTYGDDVAEVIVKEGPASIDVLRKTGRGGWRFFNDKVLPHKKKLIAAGVFGLFLANPEQFVDSAGRATQYAVEQFARAGVSLGGAIGGGAIRGLDTAVGGLLAPLGLNAGPIRWLVMGVALLVAVLALMALIGLPIRWVLRPFTWPLRKLVDRPRIVG
jgi:hypothetical protein